MIKSIAALVPYLTAGGLDLEWAVICPFVAATIALSLPAGPLARRFPPKLLRTGFAALVLLVAIGVALPSTLAIVS